MRLITEFRLTMTHIGYIIAGKAHRICLVIRVKNPISERSTGFSDKTDNRMNNNENLNNFSYILDDPKGLVRNMPVK